MSGISLRPLRLLTGCSPSAGPISRHLSGRRALAGQRRGSRGWPPRQRGLQWPECPQGRRRKPAHCRSRGGSVLQAAFQPVRPRVLADRRGRTTPNWASQEGRPGEPRSDLRPFSTNVQPPTRHPGCQSSAGRARCSSRPRRCHVLERAPPPPTRHPPGRPHEAENRAAHHRTSPSRRDPGTSAASTGLWRGSESGRGAAPGKRHGRPDGARS